jgi:hypothetical protein
VRAAARWPEWIGGVIVVGVTAVPPPALAITLGAHPSPFREVLSLWTSVLSLLLLTLLAPLAGRSRRYALWALVPFWNFVIAWEFGRAIIRSSRKFSSPPDRPAERPRPKAADVA